MKCSVLFRDDLMKFEPALYPICGGKFQFSISQKKHIHIYKTFAVANDDNVTWKSLFEQYNLSPLEPFLISTNSINYDDEEPIVNPDVHYNAFELMSSFLNENSNQKLGQRLIDVTYD